MDALRRRRILDVYAALMEEIKARMSWIESAVAASANWPSPQATYEFGYLQLRLICETLALGCLVVHGEGGLRKKLKSEYAADKIIDRVEKLHPDFYPRPSIVSLHESGRYDVHIKDSEFFTKNDLVKLYWKCGGILHRGNLKGLMSRGAPEDGFPQIRDSLEKLKSLLHCHTIFFLDNKTMVVCHFRHPEANGAFRWYAFEHENLLSLLKS
jgi:hypothetical protein